MSLLYNAENAYGFPRGFKRKQQVVRKFQVGSIVKKKKNLPANTRDSRDRNSVLGSERSPGGGNGKPLQYSCLENPMDRGAWWATVQGFAESGMREWLSAHTQQMLSP